MPLPLDPPWAFDDYEGPEPEDDDREPQEPMEEPFAAEKYFEAYEERMELKYG